MGTGSNKDEEVFQVSTLSLLVCHKKEGLAPNWLHTVKCLFIDPLAKSKMVQLTAEMLQRSIEAPYELDEQRTRILLQLGPNANNAAIFGPGW